MYGLGIRDSELTCWLIVGNGGMDPFVALINYNPLYIAQFPQASLPPPPPSSSSPLSSTS